MTAAIAVGGALVLVALAWIDARRRVVPNRIVLPAAAVIVALHCAAVPGRALEWVAAALGAFAFLLMLHAAYPPGLGMGDVKLGLLLGALLGRETPEALVVGSLLLAAVGVVLVVARGAAARKVALPFAPFLAVGALIALLGA